MLAILMISNPCYNIGNDWVSEARKGSWKGSEPYYDGMDLFSFSERVFNG